MLGSRYTTLCLVMALALASCEGEKKTIGDVSTMVFEDSSPQLNDAIKKVAASADSKVRISSQPNPSIAFVSTRGANDKVLSQLRKFAGDYGGKVTVFSGDYRSLVLS